MADSSPDYKALYLAEVRRREQVEEQIEEAKEQTRPTTFLEFVRECHVSLSLPLGVQMALLSTKGSLTNPSGKLCPTQLRPWTECSDVQQGFYDTVCAFLRSSEEDPPRSFSPIIGLQDLGERLCRRRLGSERDLEIYEHLAVEDHVQVVISELLKIPQARKKYKLGDGIKFENHSSSLDNDDAHVPVGSDQPRSQKSKPDEFWIRRLDGQSSDIVATAEYKPPHKLTVEYLRLGLRPMNLWEEVVQRCTIPTDRVEKVKYNAEQLSGAALTQEFHVMIHEGLEYSYITNGLAFVLLHVREDDPSTLYYYLAEPNLDVDLEDDESLRHPKTAVSRVLCLCLMSCLSRKREQKWRSDAMEQLHHWEVDFEQVLRQFPEEERRETPPGSEYRPESSSSLSSSSLNSSREIRRVHTRSQNTCAPSGTTNRSASMDSSDSDSEQAATGRKRKISQVASSPPNPESSRQTSTRNEQQNQRQHDTVQFCTQQCLLGLQTLGRLDHNCPNFELHQRGSNDTHHLINTGRLVELLDQQLGEDLDHNCTPFGECGSYGAPFKITCASYGYTLVGKGTTTRHWNEVSKEADIYRILQKAQGSAVPVFLGKIDMKRIYFYEKGARIQHMLLMAWGGIGTRTLEHDSTKLRHEIKRSKKEIRDLGVVHGDLRFENILWNPDLQRAQIIDFHRSRLVSLPAEKRGIGLTAAGEGKRSKRPRVV